MSMFHFSPHFPEFSPREKRMEGTEGYKNNENEVLGFKIQIENI